MHLPMIDVHVRTILFSFLLMHWMHGTASYFKQFLSSVLYKHVYTTVVSTLVQSSIEHCECSDDVSSNHECSQS